MQTDYHIEALVHQTEDLVVYRVSTRDKTPLALVRLRYDDDILERLKGGVFENALAQLQQLSHSCLRSVIDGGLDPIDGFPWIAVRWWEGTLITDRVRDSDLTTTEFARIEAHGEALIEALGPIAGTVSFTPRSVVTCGQGEQIVDTFSIDYLFWFAAFADGVHPADRTNGRANFDHLLTYLNRHSTHTSTPLVTVAQAPPTPAHQPHQLASAATSGFPLKTVSILVLLLTSIGFLSWKILDRKSPATTTQVAASEDVKKLIKEPEINRPLRPRLDVDFNRIDITNPENLKASVGQWVWIEGEITSRDEQGFLLVANSDLKAALPPASDTTAQNTLGNKVIIRGFLTSPTLLEIQDQTDVEISYLLKDVYTINDENQLRTDLVGQFITIRATPLSLGESSSGKTLYLQFKKEENQFAISIEKSKADAALTGAHLKSLVGKTIQAKGRVKIDSKGGRLSISITKSSQLKIVD